MNLVGSGTVNGKIYGSATLGTLAPTTSGGTEIDLLNGGDSSTAFTGAETATVQLVIRKDTSANWNANNPILNDGELGFITDDQQFFVGDGVTAYQDLLDAHYIVHWDELTSILSGINNSISDLQSAVTGNTNDINTLDDGLQQELLDRANGDSTLQGQIDSLGSSVSSVEAAYSGILIQINTLDGRVDTTESSISTISTNLASEVTARGNADISLQGQIDTINTSLADGLLKKFEVSINLADIDSSAESNIDLILPTAGKTLMPFHASVIIDSSNTSSGESVVRLKNESDVNIFEDQLFDDTGAWNGLSVLQINRAVTPLFILDGKMLLYLTLGNSWSGATGTMKIIIFYMEV